MTLPTTSPSWEPRPAPPVLASDMIELGWKSRGDWKMADDAEIPLQRRHVVLLAVDFLFSCTHFEQEGTETTEKELSSVPSVSSCSCC
jgi:hypothetical protein